MSFFIFLVVAAPIAAATVFGAGRARDRTTAVAICVAGAAAVMIIDGVFHVRFYADDSFITLRYARNLADGNGPVWNPGERVEGYTSFAWMALLAGMYRVGFDLEDASLVLSYTAMAGTLAAVAGVWSLWRDSERPAQIIDRPATLAAALLLTGVSAPVVVWGFSGMETPLAACLLTAGAFRLLREQRDGGVPYSALVFAAGAMTRPEFLPVAAATAAWLALAGWRADPRAALRRALLWSGVFAAAYVPYFAWRYAYYGYIFPNTYYVKVGNDQLTLERGLSYLYTHGSMALLLPLMLGVAVAAAALPRVARDHARYILLIATLWLVVVVVEGGDAFSHGRFLMPVIPLVTLAGVAGIATALDAAVAGRRALGAVALAAATAAALSLAQASTAGDREFGRRAIADWRDSGELLAARVPEGYTVGVFAAGAIPYYSQLPSLDLLGLTDETIAHSPSLATASTIPAHEKANTEYVLTEARPEIIIIGGVGFQPELRSTITAAGATIGIPAYSTLVTDPRTWELYQMSALRLGARWLNFLQRKDTLGTFRPDWTEDE